MTKKTPLKSSPIKNIKSLKARVEKVEQKLAAATLKEKEKVAGRLDDLKTQLAWQYLEEDEYGKAAAIYDRLPKGSNTREKYCGKARILIETEKYAEAEKFLNKGLTEFPDYVPFLNTLGILYNNMGDPYKALKCLDRAISIAPENNPSSLQNKAGALKRLKYHSEALKLWSELVNIYPEDPYYVFERGYCWLMLEKYPEAIEDLRKALSNGYSSSGLYTGLCKAYSALDCIHEAFSIALKGVESYPETYMLYSHIGMGHLLMEQFEEAEEAFKKGLALDPESGLFNDLLQMVAECATMAKAKV